MWPPVAAGRHPERLVRRGGEVAVIYLWAAAGAASAWTSGDYRASVIDDRPLAR